MSNKSTKAVPELHHWRFDAQFWVAFWGLNALLFLPLTVLLWGDIRPNSATSWLEYLFVSRPNSDLFRLSVEWAFLMAIWVVLRPIRNRLGRILLGLLYFLTFAYYLYEAIKVAFFASLPVAFDDFFLLRDSGSGLFQHFDFPLWMIAAVFGPLLLIGYLLRFVTVERIVGKLHWFSQVALIVLTFPGLVSMALLPNVSASPDGVFSSVGLKIVGNSQRSGASRAQQLAAENLLARRPTMQKEINSAEIEQSTSDQARDFRLNPYDYRHATLTETPTIYLIFLESYGDVLYTHPDLRDPFSQLIEELDAELAATDWQVASSFSWTPVYGGGSWLAYTSMLTGLNVNNEPLYNTLVKQSVDRPLFSLTRYLQTQGYLYNRVTPLPVDSPEEIAYLDELTHFYGYDNWLTIDDLAYEGSVYGWGPAPPDQYTLNYLHDYANSQAQPSLNFFITHNSHAPWGTQPALVSDWRDLQTVSSVGEVVVGDSDFSAENYFTAIEYQLRTAIDFVKQETREDVIFILVGDHQPPRISPLDGSPYTPLHIIGRDQAFIDDFYFFEFANSLRLPKLDIGIHHEGFLSLFMRAFLGNYSDTSYDDLPPYLPNGLRFGARG
ncbi:MAG: sulfatase-like hydrolase/transferase [Candidatus Promineifilaceae bacterium]